jgi:hypothetical protein
MFNYWLSIFLADLCKFLILIVIIFPFLLLHDSQYIYALFVIFFFIVVSCLFIYCFSFIFEKEEQGQKFFLLASYLGMITLVIVALVQYKMKVLSDEFLWSFADLLPSSFLAFSLIRLYVPSLIPSEFSMDVNIGKIMGNIAFSGCLQIFFYIILLYLLEKRIFETLAQKLIFSNIYRIQKDEGYGEIGSTTMESIEYAKKEKEKVKNNQSLSLKIYELTKIYRCCFCCRPVKAVNKVIYLIMI